MPQRVNCEMGVKNAFGSSTTDLLLLDQEVRPTLTLFNDKPINMGFHHLTVGFSNEVKSKIVNQPLSYLVGQ